MTFLFDFFFQTRVVLHQNDFFKTKPYQKKTRLIYIRNNFFCPF